MVLALACCAALASVLSVSCLIADPSAQLPDTPASPPSIESANVLPATNTVLTVWPSEFVVPISRINAAAQYEWQLYIDYDSSNGNGLVDDSSGPILDTVVELSATAPVVGGCHVIEFLVATSFVSVESSRATPAGVGTDGVTWFYSPTGDLAGCPVTVDAGFDGAFPVADGGDGGEGGLE